ncbi:MAG: tyrosine-type recombinase/integrase [Hyphomicrobiaceae bacterium]
MLRHLLRRFMPQSVSTPSPTFQELSEQWADAKARTLRPDWVKEARRILRRDVLPYLGEMRADAVTRRDVSAVLERITARGAMQISAHALRVTHGIYAWAQETGRYSGANPARGMRVQHAGTPRDRVLSDDEIRAVWEIAATPAVRDALRLQLLCGLRITEAMGIRRSEIDLAQRLLTLPGKRTKSRRIHRLPLSPLAMEIVEGALAREPKSEFLFPSEDPSRPVRAKSAQRATLRLAMGFSSHDLRRTCATRLGELGVPDEVIERVMNHAPLGVTRERYNHSERLDSMRAALDRWAICLQAMVATSRPE